ncbi:MAG: O-antigen ligase family protein, partial [Anaerolineae bacterium]
MDTVKTSAAPLQAPIRRFDSGKWPVYLALAVLLGGSAGVVSVRADNALYVLVGLVGLLTFIGSVISAEFGLLLLVFLAYTRFSDIAVHTYGAISVLQVFMVLQAVAILLRWAVSRRAPTGWLMPTLVLGAYGIAATSSMLRASDSSLVLKALEIFAKDAVIAVVVVMLLQRQEAFRRMLWVLIIAGILLASLSAYQFLTRTFTNSYGGFAMASLQQIVGQTNDYRIGGPIGDPNFFAQILIVIIPIALERFLHERQTVLRLLALYGALVCVACTLFTYSRGGFLSLAVVMIVFFLVYPPRALQIPIFILAVVGVALIIPPNYWDRILSLNQFFQTPGMIRTNDPALRGRATENLAAWEMFKGSPLMGVGWGNYTVAYPT